jgi:hypothetical protein
MNSREELDALQDWELYLRCWKLALRELLGWAPEVTERWAQTRGPRGPRPGHRYDSSFLTHETPAYHLTPLFTPSREQLKAHGYTLPQFDEEFIRAVEARRTLQVYEDAHYDWMEVRDRVDVLLRRVGASLEDVRRSLP